MHYLTGRDSFNISVTFKRDIHPPSKESKVVFASDLLYSQHHQRLLQCWDKVLDNYHRYRMSVPSCLLSRIQILVM